MPDNHSVVDIKHPNNILLQSLCFYTCRDVTYESPFMSVLNYSGSIQYLEHMVVTLTVVVGNNSTYGKRGDIGIELTSPSGTVSTLLGYRYYDYYNDYYEYYNYYNYSDYYDYYDYYDSDVHKGYYDWPFKSVMFWGEDPAGEWSLKISSKTNTTEANVNYVDFKFYGVSSIPESVANIPDECHSDCRRGCAQEGSEFCDACVNLRNAYTLECIDTCPLGYTEHNGYCYDPHITWEECNSPLKLKEEGESYMIYCKIMCTDVGIHLQVLVLMLDSLDAALMKTVQLLSQDHPYATVIPCAMYSMIVVMT